MAFKCQLNVLLSYGGQVRAQEAAVKQTFRLERSSFFYLSTLMCETQTLALAPALRK